MHHVHGIDPNGKAREAMEEYENAYRRGESTLESQSPLGIGFNLEKEWSPMEGSSSGDSTVSVAEPEKVATKPGHGDENSDRLEGTTTAQRVVTAQDWIGPDDPENPLNWPTLKKVYHTIPPALFGFVV